MPLDHIIIDGDLVLFSTVLGTTGVALGVIPVTIKGTGKITVQGKPVCIEDDVKTVMLNCQYINPPYTVPGSGTLKIKKLADDQLTQKTKSGDHAVLLKGSKFEAEFQVAAFAINPGVVPPKPDDTMIYQGEGQFLHAQENIKAT